MRASAHPEPAPPGGFAGATPDRRRGCRTACASARSEVTPGMAAFDEETFGPVAAITVARDDDHAVELANSTDYGLGLSVWSGATEHAVAVARRITSGAAFVNAIVASDPRVPFGGTKRSGYGRELADAGLLAFTNTRTFWVAS
ncbi:aldehyde dehydrogenase family protein [Nostocoides australiense]|nr:aldehyde dehydrogenase family protein [Tetrasphaera australiensis]HRW00311.1 aldehyde dehydrogenase family protein [Tetrasphaera sp.]